jgi:hypothetical protein
MTVSKLRGMVLTAIMAGPAFSAAAIQETEQSIHAQVTKWLKASTDYVSCDDRHFIYGVGYIDGSYMERIFYVSGDGSHPILSIDLRDGIILPEKDGGDIGPISFVVEITAAKVLHATPDKGGWRVNEEGWETALRFKYTSWFGTVSRRNGQWSAQWGGYRRPMLPENVKAHVKNTCDLFVSP